MTREEMIDEAFAGDEIGDVSQIDDDDDEFYRFVDEFFSSNEVTEVNDDDDDDDEEFSRFIDEALSRKPEKLSGAAKKRGRKIRAMINRALNQPPVLHPLEAFVLERSK